MTHLAGMKVLCVCLGNICRSPLAQGILEVKAKARNIDIEVDSAGTSNYNVGKAPDPRSVAEADKHNLDLNNQRARQLRAHDLVYYDHILVMDASNYQKTVALAPSEEARAKVKLIMNYVEPGRNISIPDPYWDDNGFPKVYAMLEGAVDAFLDAEAS